MTETKMFPTLSVVSAVRGILLCDIGEVYKALSFLVGRSVFTHELPAASREAQPHVIAEHPWIGTLDLSGVTTANWQQHADRIVAEHGVTLTITPIGWNRVADQNPIDSLIEMVGPEKVIVVKDDSHG